MNVEAVAPIEASEKPARHVPVLIIGGGQAGLSVAHYLKCQGIAHLIIEKRRVAHSWRSERWDSFCLVTPNWQCQLPDFPYAGNDSDGFMLRDEIVAYVEAFARKVDPPLLEGAAVTSVRRDPDGVFEIATTAGLFSADNVVVAISGYHIPSIPLVAERMPASLTQLHSSQYRNARSLPEGGVLVIGTGQSGCQIAEDLHIEGRRVHLSVGSAPRSPRLYRGRDVIAWLHDLGHYDMPVDEHPLKENVRRNPNHYMSGRGGGREIDLRRFAREGMQLYGRFDGLDGERMRFSADLAKNLDGADAVYTGIRALIDRHIEDRHIEAPAAPPYVPVWHPEHEQTELDLVAAGISSVIWCTGFRSDFGFVEIPVFDSRGMPVHKRGVTAADGLYFVGLPWLYTWGSGRFGGIARDARYIGEHIAARMRSSVETSVQLRRRRVG